MLRPSSVTRLLTLHTLPPPSAFRNHDALSVLRKHTPPTQYRTRRSVVTVTTETTGTQHSVLIHAPTLEDIGGSEYDADLIPLEEVKLGITQRAAEVRFDYLQSPVPRSPLPNIYFRSAPGRPH
jgi:hypothetical protein